MLVKTDVVIMVAHKNINILKSIIPYVKKNISKGKIYAVSSQTLKDDINMIPGVLHVDESTIISGMTFDFIGELIEKAGGSKNKTGWYFQQFLKLGWAKICENNFYIVIDADTFPLNPIDFIDDSGKYLFTQKIEYNKPYFNTINNLFDGTISRQGDFSFVAEHMIFDRKYVLEMIDEIEKRHPERGNVFFEIIINSIDRADISASGFSEFETYGTYVFSKHPEKVRLRKLRTLREATYLLGGKPSKEKLDWASNDYDIISIEIPGYHRTLMTTFTNIKIVRGLFTARQLAGTRKKIRTFYRRIVGKKDFEFD